MRSEHPKDSGCTPWAGFEALAANDGQSSLPDPPDQVRNVVYHNIAQYINPIYDSNMWYKVVNTHNIYT